MLGIRADRRVMQLLIRGRSVAFPVGAAVRLAFLQLPSATATSDLALGAQPVLVAVDASGFIVPGSRTITATPDVGGATNTTAGTDVNGIAAFSGLQLNTIGGSPVTTRTLTFSSPGLTSITAQTIVSDACAGGDADICALRNIGSCEILLDAIAGVTGDGANITAINDLSGKGRTITLPDGTIPFTSTKWNGALPAWQFIRASLKRIMINGGTGTPPYPTLPGPMTLCFVMDQLTNVGGPMNLYRDNSAINTVGFMQAGGGWALYDGIVANSALFSAANVTGKVARLDVHNGVASLIRVTDTEEVLNPGNTAMQMGQHYIGSNSANNAGVSAIMAMYVLYSKALSATERDQVVAIMKKRYPGIANPTLGHGPILSASSVIDGITVTVAQVSPFVGSQFTSTELYHHTIVIRFSSPLRQFALTQLSTEFSGGQANGAALIACDDFGTGGGPNGIVNWKAAAVYQNYANVPGERLAVRYDAGFSCVVISNLGINQATYGTIRSLWDNGRFWLVGEPL
jgi:hypothetical protein